MSEIILNLLRKAQKKSGYLSEEILKKISKKTKIPISRLYGVATFYTMLRTSKQGKHIIEICGSPSCYVNGGIDLENFLEKELGIEIGETTKDGKISLYKTSCIGCCDKAPAMLLDGKAVVNLTKEKVKEIIKKCRS
ncbi:NAD(P)H-dependent oxidoreductase subunit E [Candidatus Woesearchaeota archaeon]|nr:NAD(P)H-dependent oxidoreductase subunit E [Candidatus Woesearchaeota archaeon]